MNLVHIALESGEAIVTLSNPPLNLIARQLTRELGETLSFLKTNWAVVVVCGAGSHAVSAGSDIMECTGLMNHGAVVDEKLALENELFDRLAYLPQTGYFLCLRDVAKHMASRRTGSIVSVASQLAYRGGAGLAHYSAAKEAVLGLTGAAVRELAEYGVRANSVTLGPIQLGMTAPYETADWVEAKLAASVLKRLGRPDHVAGTVIFLASDASALYIGQTPSPNGGGVMP